ncbi:MAG: DUF5012 domain-containing protein [Fermentimonas sp.]|uniref:BT_2262 family domain-containing protein n=1 Tax=Petrimonas sp. TaxID=2023866 RepID=UPI0030D07BA2|nr:DUF5012 domain-containing protein [Fermentimonas sp.]
MKKITTILSILALVFFILCFSGCEDESTAGFTNITYYPDIVMEGDETVYIGLGEAFDDPGATATENGVEIDVNVSSNVNIQEPGLYYIGYSATNVDGFKKTVRRKVYVYDSNLNTTDLSGTYNASVIRSGTESYSNNPVTLTSTHIPGIYMIDDWIAGFYAIGRDYGEDYMFNGLIQINGDNEVIHLDMSNPWGDSFTNVEGTYNPVTGVIAYKAVWEAGYTFDVTMSK